MEQFRVLLVDAAPGPLLGRELERLLGHGLAVTLNLRRVADRAAVLAEWGDRVEFTDFDPFDEAALLAGTVRDGLGHHAVKSRAGVPLRAAFLAGAARPGLAHPLRVIGRAGAGTDHVDLAAAARHGVTVTHTPGSNADAVAEFALAQLLTLTRDIRSYDAAAHRGEWRAPVTPPPELSELTLGIVGAGRIGLALAGRAGALGMDVQALARHRDAARAPRPGLASVSAPGPAPAFRSAARPAPAPAPASMSDPRPAPALASTSTPRPASVPASASAPCPAPASVPAPARASVSAPGPAPALTSAARPAPAPASMSAPRPAPALASTQAPRPVLTLPELLATSDVVSLHLPLTPETRGLIGRAELALMRPGAILLNTARGGIVDEQALADALRDPAHPLAAAAVDTFEHEHAAFASPLHGLPNALLTPHIAGMTRGAMATAALRCADHMAALLAGRPDGIPVATA
ncbi:oxidoreductase [Streptomyces sp. OUCMDZ-4982]|uniref:NAD(P)-dependent oxidoreductase n=1 Tax=Streptomyces sp. OUCMDZ-4982 TaxID=2973090 RepID=UPI00215BF596|nr:NAD(P)-dependent oxidoreductase [Streptomyces sp. OUCMDZ-4982]MCR8944317.1 oxidoreductase [Streptomyces sp. OUCMDZ-4982]